MYIEKDRCLYCGRSSLFGLTHPVCQRRYGIDGLVSIFFYNGFLQKIIKTIKYRLATDAWEDLSKTIDPHKLAKLSFFKQIKKELGLLYLQPIPLHIYRMQIRGFNQAQIIAEFFQRILSIPSSSVLTRNKPTRPQAELQKGKERFLNMRRAFEVKEIENISNNNYILVDDVVTTGATLKEAARVLKLNGAEQVFALTLARG